jgi:hypothetical protein
MLNMQNSYVDLTRQKIRKSMHFPLGFGVVNHRITPAHAIIRRLNSFWNLNDPDCVHYGIYYRFYSIIICCLSKYP